MQLINSKNSTKAVKNVSRPQINEILLTTKMLRPQRTYLKIYFSSVVFFSKKNY